MSSPSMLVMNCGKAFSFASAFCNRNPSPSSARGLHRRKRHALRLVGDRFLLGDRVQPSAGAPSIASCGISIFGNRRIKCRHPAPYGSGADH